MVGSDFAPCDGFDCRNAPPPHDRLAGNVTVSQVLETFRDGNGPGAQLARLHLARLEQELRPCPGFVRFSAPYCFWQDWPRRLRPRRRPMQKPMARRSAAA